MSTRGWYEYYVIDLDTGHLYRPLQFHKWGDATPDNALHEYSFFKEKLDNHDCSEEIQNINDFLKGQLESMFKSLPPYFATAVFFFFLQRAWEKIHSFKKLKYLDMPEEERPDYRLGFAVGQAEVLNPKLARICRIDDEHIDLVNFFVNVGRFVRPWKSYGLQLSALSWLQYLTQDTFEADMGSIAGFTESSWDEQFHFRFFFTLRSSKPCQVEKISIQLADRSGDDLLQQTNIAEGNTQKAGELTTLWCDNLQNIVHENNVDLFSLSEAERQFKPVTDDFWTQPEEPPPIDEENCQPV